jgi:multidrug resistance efflux pump
MMPGKPDAEVAKRRDDEAKDGDSLARTSSRIGTSPPFRQSHPATIRTPTMIGVWARRLVRTVATSLLVGVTALASLAIWNFYVAAPWTRDGRVRAQVAEVAPQISGQITGIDIVDNQYVHKGDVLFVVDPFDFRIALLTAKASVEQSAADLQVKRLQAERRLHLSDLATTAEEQQSYVGQAREAEARYEIALQQEAQAEVNLERTEVRSPVNGFVTNLLLRVGDYAHVGMPSVYIIDSDSYWIDGYFEETKLARLCVGDKVEAKLIGFSAPITGVIETVTRGISVSDATPSIQGLPDVNAVYTWVRLAQRVPVRIRITRVPAEVPLIAGLTATVSDVSDSNPHAPFDSRWRLIQLARGAFDFLGHQPRRAGCIPPTVGATGSDTTIPVPSVPSEVNPNEINPGLAPGLNMRPESP